MVSNEKALTVRQWLYKASTVKQLEAALPNFMNGERFLRVFWSAMMVNPRLQDCTEQSILSAMIQCAQLGLEPILGKAALVPFKNKGTLEVQFQPMYRGLIDLARRTGEIKITAHGVYSKDEFDVLYGTEEKVHHRVPIKGDRGELIGAYTVWTFQESGMQTSRFMRREEIEYIRDTYSKSWQNSGQNSVWGKHPREMFVKTVIKSHVKLQPCSIEMEHAVNLDDKVEMGTETTGLFLPGTEEKFMELPPAPVTASDMALEKRASRTEQIKEFTEKTNDPGQVEIKDELKEAMEKSREKESDWITQIVIPSGISSEKINLFVDHLCKEHDIITPETITKGALDDPQGFITALKDWHSRKSTGPDKPNLFEKFKSMRPGTSEKNLQVWKDTVTKHADAIREMPKDEHTYIYKKWQKACPGEPFPARPITPSEQPQAGSQAQEEEGPTGQPGNHLGQNGAGDHTENVHTEAEYLDEFNSMLAARGQEIETDNPRMNSEEFERYMAEQAEKRTTSVTELKIWIAQYKRFDACWDGFLKRIGIPTNGEVDE